ncbi:MAG: helix-turn-helix domain-containing protein [Planctomycetia bacterium]|nr:helix-turn-helix domain-containing protein [Planctomycetia bacterium]
MKPLLTRKEAAKLLGCSPRTIDLWRVRNALPFLKVGHFVRYDPEELEYWVKEHSHHKKGT